MPFATSSILVPSSKARSPQASLLLVDCQMLPLFKTVFAAKARVWKVERLDIYKNLLRACERQELRMVHLMLFRFSERIPSCERERERVCVSE